ncbi:hypothetical protein A3A49_00530 [Candidatus Curtissbacteria bacterium RIFCSPLOWO2_01_FULL_38_11b]|uniref:Lactamase n=1 Tax=Candidatus Curtissbacteria bacterium RIFCSPLOWO2_01_FULL_38_11b TaxID=1797725 RepID=A0A1F5GZX7_9BACT|nr:MAG: hypothetical protein A3A49_00530 [Candidatus Curtissbacteria bacterium RIFCSPLOWO2_01_FULL_38_11b]
MVDIWWYGQACVRVKGKNASLVFDPYDAVFTGLKPLKLEANIVCVTHAHQDHNYVEAVRGVDGELPFVISGPGEYEKSGVNIVGVASYHDDKNGTERGKNTIYLTTIDEVNIVHLGDLGQKKLTQDQIEQLSLCDVVMIPVGGVYTITYKEAPDIIAVLEPKIVIPIHYRIPGLKFNLDPVDNFLKAMGKEAKPQAKLSISKERLPEELEIIVLEMQ